MSALDFQALLDKFRQIESRVGRFVPIVNRPSPTPPEEGGGTGGAPEGEIVKDVP